MIVFALWEEFQTRQPQSAPACKDPFEELSSPITTLDPDSSFLHDKFPLICEKAQCVFCISNEQLPYKQRTRKFHRVLHMWDHVENIYLHKFLVKQLIICPHPVCKAQGSVLNHAKYFKNHVATIHEINLRPRACPDCFSEYTSLGISNVDCQVC
jgi:hypothetical protein